MSDLSEHLCIEAVSMASSSPLNIIYAVRICLGIVGMFCVPLLLKYKGTSWIANKNAKVLFYAHIYFAFHVSFYFFLFYIFQLTRIFVYKDQGFCSLVINARLSCLVRLIPVIGIHGQTFNMFTFAIERAISTLWPRKYEKITKNYFGLLLVFTSVSFFLSKNKIQTLCVILLNFLLLFVPISSDKYVSGWTVRNPENMANYQLMNIIVSSMEVLTITVFSMTYFLNLRKSRGLHYTNLGNKYQIAENKKVISILLPCFAVHFVMNFLSYVGQSLYPMFYSTFDIITSTIWVEAVSQGQNYSIILPLVFFWVSRKSRRIAVHNSSTATDIYFQQLNSLFDVKND